MADSPDRDRGVYMISVAAELAGMHPQTLRIYETRGLITPKRSPKNTRLYSQEDVERLRRIQELTGELGMNLAGVERVFELEEEIDRMRRRMRNLERHAQRVQAELEKELERVRRSFKFELVPYEPPSQALMPREGERGVRIPCAARRLPSRRSPSSAAGPPRRARPRGVSASARPRSSRVGGARAPRGALARGRAGGPSGPAPGAFGCRGSRRRGRPALACTLAIAKRTLSRTARASSAAIAAFPCSTRCSCSWSRCCARQAIS